jgi:tetratricopeptide (TPR) repeat protein
MTLTISITGEGTLDSAASPDLEKIPAIAEHFKIYKPTELTKGNQRQFTYSLRPLDADVREFPAVPLSYFDVDKGSYVTLRTEPIPIEVTKAVRLAERDIVASAPGFSGNAKEIETRREGIFANMTDAAELGDESVHPERWLSGLAGLASGYALLAVGVSRWRRISGDAALLRRRAAAGLAKRRLRESAAEFAAGRAREGADHVQTALLGLVADMLDLPAAGLTPAEACQRLESLGVESNLLGRLRTLLETCEGVRYGASAGGSESLNRDAQEMLRILTSALKRQKAPQLVSSLCLLGILSSLLLLSGCNRAVDLDLAKKFQAAQQAFEEAQKTEDFAKVAALDQEILDRGGVSGAVLYNQGNAWMRAGQPGRAVAAYRQAQRYLPRNRYLEENLRSALGRDAPATRRPVIETILFWQNWLSYPEKFSLAAAAAMATFVVAAAGLFAARRVLRRIVWAGLLLTVVLAFSAGYDWHRFDGVRHGVVTQPETIARKGNAASYAPAFNGTLREATEFELVEARGDWLLIRLPGDGEGWIEEKAAVTY